MKELVSLGRGCKVCGEPLFTTTPNNVKAKMYCSDACRYKGWQDKYMQEMIVLAKKLARVRD